MSRSTKNKFSDDASYTVISQLTKKTNKKYDRNAILFLARFVVLCEGNFDRLKFSQSNKTITAYPIWSNIFQFLFDKEFQLFSLTSSFSKKASQLANFSICFMRPSLLSIAIDEVVRVVLCGNEDLARHIIAANPNYLCRRGSAMDFSDRIYTDRTPFQAALSAGDVQMCKMMKHYFASLPDGDSEMQEQLRQVFKNNQLTDSNVDLTSIFNAHLEKQQRDSQLNFKPMLDAVITAIENASFEDLIGKLYSQHSGQISDEEAVKILMIYDHEKKFGNGSHFFDDIRMRDLALQTEIKLRACVEKYKDSALNNALLHFKTTFTQLSNDENVFNPQHLLRTLEAISNLRRSISTHKRNIIWCDVLGFIQRFLPACYIQAYAQGMCHIFVKDTPLQRTFPFKKEEKTPFFYTLPLSDHSKLGFDFAMHAGNFYDYSSKYKCTDSYISADHDLFSFDRQKTYIERFISYQNKQFSEFIRSERRLCVIQ